VDLLNLGVIDEIIPEPRGGAHANPADTIERVRVSLSKHLAELKKIPPEELPDLKLERFSKMGTFVE
jgi:acetyl-CoA carboxylase carboxyl transferase subunit alpha